MQQHPVPQHMASFEFKLFGNLTVRQFIALAIPGSIGILIFFSSLPRPLSFPLAAIFIGIGFLAALVPVQGRPLDKWLVAFFKAIMSPTQRVWVKQPRTPEFLTVALSLPKANREAPQPITRVDRERLAAYLRNMPQGRVSPLDVKEQVALQGLGLQREESEGGKLPPPIIWPTNPTAPTDTDFLPQSSLPQVSPRATTASATSMPGTPQEFEQGMQASLPTTQQYKHVAAPGSGPTISSHAQPYALPGLETRLNSSAKSFAAPTQDASTSKLPVQHETPVQLVRIPRVQLASETNFSVENVIPIMTPNKQVRLLHGIGKTRARKLHFSPPEGFDLSKLPIRGERRFEISEELKKHLIEPSLFEEPQKTHDIIASNSEQIYQRSTNHPADIISDKPKEDQNTQPINTSSMPMKKSRLATPKPQVSLKTPKDIKLKTEQKVAYEAQMQMPVESKRKTTEATPNLQAAQIVPLTNIPNVLSGIITMANGSPIEGAIMTVQDQSGIPIRALKTNKLGQFLSATPLSSGTYTLEIESQLAEFEPINIALKGEVMKPLEIRAKKG